jgi:hypothetical protein
MNITREDLELFEVAHEYLSYNSITGMFYWKKSPNWSIAVGQQTGQHKNSNGYQFVCVKGIRIPAHRLAWIMVNKTSPDQIDHMNGERSDNRIANLRSVSSRINSQNQRLPHKNNSSGALGVVKKPNGRFYAKIVVMGKKKWLGTFDTLLEASQAYRSTKLREHEGALP